MARKQTYFLLFVMLTVGFVLCDNALKSVEDEGMFNKSLESCLKKSPQVSKEKVMAVLESVFKDPVDQDMKCVLLCIGNDMGEMNSEGVINVEKSLQNIPENVNKDVVKTIGEACVTLKGADKCDTALLQFKCISEKALAKKAELMKKS